MYIGFGNKSVEQNAITDYLCVVQPKLQSIEGVQTAEILGLKTFAPPWLDPVKLASYNLTATDVMLNRDFREQLYLRPWQHQAR